MPGMLRLRRNSVLMLVGLQCRYNVLHWVGEVIEILDKYVGQTQYEGKQLVSLRRFSGSLFYYVTVYSYTAPFTLGLTMISLLKFF